MPDPTSADLRREFLASLRDDDLVGKLLDHLPDTVSVFIKDAGGRFMLASPSFRRRIGLADDGDIVGKTDHDFFWAPQAESYRQDDETVLRTGESQIEKLEIIPSADGQTDWFRTSKHALRGRDGRVAGLLGVTHDLRTAHSALQPYRTMEPVIRHIMTHYAEPIDAAGLAAVAGMSVPRFTRRFKREFQTTPGRYLAAVRLNVTCRLLTTTRKPIADIATEAGFYDHSFFTKQFVKYKGMTPRAFRARFREGAPAGETRAEAPPAAG